MNTIDLIVCLALLLAAVSGWRQGLILQVCSLAGLVAAIWLATSYGSVVGGWLRLDASIAAPGGFVVVLLVVVLAVAIAARLVRKLFHFAGFGLPDTLLGIPVALVKCLLILSVLLSAFVPLNGKYHLLKDKTIEESLSYKPLMQLSEHVFPFLEWVGEQVPLHDEVIKNE